LGDRQIGSPNELKAIDIQTFRNATRDINFDVYLKLSETNVAHVFSKTTGLDYKRLAGYIQKGVTHLHIHSDDVPLYQAFVARPAYVVISDPNISQEKRIAILLNMTEQNMAELFTLIDVSDETAQSAQRVIRNYVDLMMNTPETLAVILKLVSHGEYLYYHSIAVSVFSMFIAKASGQFNQRTLELVGMGGFLHDIGATQLPREYDSPTANLSKEELLAVQAHAQIGLKMIENTPSIPDEVRHIVYQHHEEPSGRGYPNRLYAPTIYYPAKIVALADAFSGLISKRSFRSAYTVENAIKILEDSVGKYDANLVKILSSVFMRSSAKREAA
jgi:putative nucleotidyltransferase with HDIG domain